MCDYNCGIPNCKCNYYSGNEPLPMIRNNPPTKNDIKYLKTNGHLFGFDIEEIDGEQSRKKRRIVIDNIFNSINGGRSAIKLLETLPPAPAPPPAPPPPAPAFPPSPSPELSQSTEQMDELLKYFESSEDMKLDFDNIPSADSVESDENLLNEFLKEIDEFTGM